jgi:polyhydroxyalkanoate synthase
MSVEPNSSSPADALAEFNRRLLENVMKPMTRDGIAPAAPEMLQSLAAGIALDSQRVLEIQKRYYEKQLALWSGFASKGADASPPNVVEPEPGDRRFRAPEWRQP